MGGIAGDLNVLAGSALIKDTAIITGNINQFIQTTEIRPKALVTGEINTYTFPSAASNQAGTRITQLIGWLRPGEYHCVQGAQVLGLILFSLIGIYLLKTPTTRIAIAIGSNLPAAWGAGLLTIITVPYRRCHIDHLNLPKPNWHLVNSRHTCLQPLGLGRTQFIFWDEYN